MKMTNKIAVAGLGLLFTGTTVFAQSLDDAKKAIDAEQYQKAKSMLKNLTVTEPTKDENFFYLGWVYLKQDYTDSAKAVMRWGRAHHVRGSSRRRKLAQGVEEAVDFFGGVVVHEADAQKAAVLLDAEAFGEIQRVVVSVPGEDAAVA